MINQRNKKLEMGLKMENALKEKKEAWVLLERMDELEEKITGIKPLDLSKLENEIRKLKEKKEDIEIELEIV